jgi:hypothetical protein
MAWPPVPEESSAAAPPFDRTEAHRWAKRLLADLEPLLAAAGAAVHRSADALEAARVERRSESVASRLVALDVETLAQRGVRVPKQALLRAGVRTAWDVWQLGYHGLDAIPGIGPTSAAQLIELVAAEARVQSTDLSLPADPTRWTRRDFDLAKALRTLASVGTLLALPHVAALQQLVELLRFLHKATRWLSWAVSPPRRRARVRSSYGHAVAQARFSHTMLDDVRRNLDPAQRVLDAVMTDEEVVRGWRENSADLLALLEQFVAQRGTHEEHAAVQHGGTGMHPDLVARIESFSLDLSLLRKTLRVYQTFGTKFALVVGRALLGDEMGLGKTVQALAAIAHAYSAERQRHHIVLCPAQNVSAALTH